MAGAIPVLDAEAPLDVPEIGDGEGGDRVGIFEIPHVITVSVLGNKERREFLPNRKNSIRVAGEILSFDFSFLIFKKNIYSSVI